MLPTSTLDYVDDGGTIYRYDSTGELISTTAIGRRRRSFLETNVYRQKLGTPNAPIVNDFWYQHHRGTYFKGSRTFEEASGRVRYRYASEEAMDGIKPPSWAFGRDWRDLEGPAYSRFLQEVRDQKADLAVDLAEGKQTYRMVQSSMDSVLSYATKLPVAPVKTLANMWLAYKYGWLPAVSSIYAVAEFTRNNLLQREVRKKTTRRQYIDGRAYVNSSRPFTASGTSVFSIKYGARMTVDNNVKYDLQRLTSLNPLGIAWELVPFSFVIDWFYDIGGFLADAETSLSLGSSLSQGYKTYYAREDLLHQRDTVLQGYIMPPTGGSFAIERVKATASTRTMYYERNRVDSWDLPRMPQATISLGSDRLITGAALLKTLFDSKRR